MVLSRPIETLARSSLEPKSMREPVNRSALGRTPKRVHGRRSLDADDAAPRRRVIGAVEDFEAVVSA
jgi:hypothetical protein